MQDFSCKISASVYITNYLIWVTSYSSCFSKHVIVSVIRSGQSWDFLQIEADVWEESLSRIPSCSISSRHQLIQFKGKGKGKGSGVWPSMVTHTRNLSSAFNPSKCTLTAVNTHPEQWAAILRRPGSSWGIGALLKGLTSVVVLKVERALVIHSPHRQSLPDLGIEPATFGLQVQLSNH